MRRYTAVLYRDPEDGRYSVEVPALPGCVTEGDTLEEAVKNARDAIQLYLEDVQACGEPIPEEATPPELVSIDV